jgi:uncharacterized Zn-finger protein
VRDKMEEEFFIECPHCGMRYTISSSEISISDIDNDPSDRYPKFCPFCGGEIEI